MAIESIYCPACNNKLRVPDELMGQQVQCPKCQAMFTAPPPPPSASPLTTDHPGAPPQRMGERHADFGYEDDRWDQEPRRLAASNRRKLPGILLIVVGLLQALMNMYGLSLALISPDELRKQFQQLQAMFPMAGAPQFDPVKAQLITTSVFLMVSIAQIAGGISLFRGRFYSLAIIGAFLAIVNCNQVCCLAGIPVGIWSLIVLFDAGVKAEFA